MVGARKGRLVVEGAGVRLRRAIGMGEPGEFDPFLLLDDFRSANPDDFRAGFPWHPHRGIETITYVLRGTVEHQDSLGNRGVIGAGDVQWMTAGRGIVHQEMPQGDDGRIEGFQLWANLPAKHKMTAPRYQGIESGAIPEHVLADGSTVRVIAGRFGGAAGPVDGIADEPDYLDIDLAPGADFPLPVRPGRQAFAYVIGGSGWLGGGPSSGAAGAELRDGTLAWFGDGDSLRLRAGRDEHFRFLFCSGMALGEPIAWSGPIVMNTQAELDAAYRQLGDGSFLKL